MGGRRGGGRGSSGGSSDAITSFIFIEKRKKIRYVHSTEIFRSAILRNRAMTRPRARYANKFSPLHVHHFLHRLIIVVEPRLFYKTAANVRLKKTEYDIKEKKCGIPEGAEGVDQGVEGKRRRCDGRRVCLVLTSVKCVCGGRVWAEVLLVCASRRHASPPLMLRGHARVLGKDQRPARTHFSGQEGGSGVVGGGIMLPPVTVT